jgi:hypothetical protein
MKSESEFEKHKKNAVGSQKSKIHYRYGAAAILTPKGAQFLFSVKYKLDKTSGYMQHPKKAGECLLVFRF